MKYKGNFAIWNIVEVLDYGDFIKLYKLYYGKYKSKDSVETFLWSVRFLRNAAAHNSCLLNSLRTPYSKEINPSKKIVNIVSRIKEIPREARQDKLKNPVVHDFVATLYVFNTVVSSVGIKQNTMKELKELFDNRMVSNKNIVDYFYSLCV